MRLQLKWTHQFQFAGYYAAQAQGYYREAGLDVSLIPASPRQDAVAAVISGQAEFGVGTADLLLRRARGQPVVVLAVIFQHSALALLSLPRSGIRSIHEVTGKRLMIENDSAELLAYLEREGIPPGRYTLLPHGFDTDALVSGAADAMSVYITDEPYTFARDGLDYALFTPRSGGIDFYGDNLFTTESYLQTNPDLVEAFRTASLRGWEYAMAHPEELADLIVARYPTAKNRAQLLFEYEQMRPLMRTDLIAVGYMYPGRWSHIAEVFAELGMLQTGFPLKGFFYSPRTLHTPPWFPWAVGGALLLVLTAGSVTLYVLWLNRRLARTMDALRQTDLSLKASRQHYQAIYENAPLPLLRFDREHRITDWNQAAERVFGWPRGEMLGAGIERIVAPDDLDYVYRVMQQTWEGQTVNGINGNLTRDGRTIMCRWSNTVQRDGLGNPVAVLSLAEDVTETWRIRRELETANRSMRTQISQIEGLQEELREQAQRDPLTGLYNRRRLHLTLNAALTDPGQAPLSLVMIDIDHFKSVNDTFGHQAGDLVLMTLARILTTGTRVDDMACRYGGEEFIVVLPGATSLAARERAESWRRAFAELRIQTPAGEVRRTLSAGIATWPVQAQDPDRLLELADQALYAAKQAGRDQTVIWGDGLRCMDDTRDPTAPTA
ncbi:MAG TPA: ABC transporter substrate-binding protein [Lamprocystis sp. (in: g-proteobacteria)]|nr:ABC transporter substrate-binding protein [Lamprocystis sp. (in: g-proteobacteria)]